MQLISVAGVYSLVVVTACTVASIVVYIAIHNETKSLSQYTLLQD